MKLPVIEMQECAPFRATLSKASCAGRWRQAQDETGGELDRLRHCVKCCEGKRNAGETT